MKTSETTNNCNNNDGDGVKLSETSSPFLSSSNENVVTTQEEASIQQRMIAGSIGALVTSLVVTPLEVVKVRQQALSKSSSNSSSSSSNSNMKGNLLNDKSVMKQRLVCNKPTKSSSTTAVLSSSSVSAANIKRCPDCGIFIFNNGIMDSVLPKSSVPSYFASITPPSSSSSYYSNKNKIKVSDMSTFQLLRYIFQREGLRNGIYAGLTPTLVMSIPNTVIYFTMYDEISYFLRQYKKTDITVANNNAASSVLIPFLSGSLARFMATLVTAPLELVRTQQAFRASLQNNNSTNNNSQVISSSSSTSSSCGVHNKVSKNKVSSTSTTKITRFCSSSSSCIHHPQRNMISSPSVSSSPNNLIQEFKQIIQKEGYSTLYKGLAPTLWRDVPFSGIYWLGVEFFKGKLNNEIQQDQHQQKQLNSDNGALVVQKSMNAFIAGLGAGMIASFLTTPFDVLKTRQQVNMLQEVTQMEKQLQQAQQQIKSHSSIHANTSKSTFQLLGKIYKEEGVVGLWRGNNARMMKVAPACAIMIFFYEFGKQVS